MLGYLAKRFLLSKTTDGFLSLITWVSVIGVSLGVLALVVVTSGINGFEGELIRVITGMNGDVLMYSRGEPVSDPQGLERKLREVAPGIDTVAATFVSEMMVSGPHGVAGGVLEGFDAETFGRVTRVAKQVVEGRMPETAGEITLGKTLSERIGGKVGEQIRLVIPFADQNDETETGGTPKIVPATVVGIVHLGMHDYDSKFMFAEIGFVQDVLGQKGKVTSFKMSLKEPGTARWVSDRLTEHFGYPFKAKDWSQLNKNLFYAIKLEKAVISISLTLIILVAAFNVVSTLMMMIHDKTREIAILKAMGLRPSQSFRLFTFIGLGIGAVGTVFGVIAGFVVNFGLQSTRLVELPPEIYYIGFLPVLYRWKEIVFISGVSLLITYLATLYPAFQVARKPPLEGLRHD